MIIGIIAAPALKEPRTGVEEYTYQLIKYLTMLEESKKHRFVLYIRSDIKFDFKLPKNFSVKILKWRLPGSANFALPVFPMWTKIRLSCELFRNKPDILFSPLGPLPLIRSKNSIATLHGLEYEYLPKAYAWFNRRFIRYNNKRSLKKAKKIIAVSEVTKNDLIKLYKGDGDKISVVYHGVSGVIPAKAGIQIIDSRFRGNDKMSYILYIGRIETKKNVQGLIKAFLLLKQKYNASHKLVLAGAKGWDYDKIFNFQFSISNYKEDIIEMGYVSEEQKWRLLSGADCFAFPSFYEGFGIPILEAQQAGCPVLTSNISSMPEVAGEGAVLVNPNNTEEICEGMRKIISDKEFKKNLIKKGRENVKSFSWRNCAKETLQVIAE